MKKAAEIITQRSETARVVKNVAVTCVSVFDYFRQGNRRKSKSRIEKNNLNVGFLY